MPRLALLALLLAAPAWATGTYPNTIKRYLRLATEPRQSCGLCHRDNLPAAGTVTTPFGTSMRGQGLLPNDERSLTAALDALDAAMTDSDADGAPDLAELRRGADPNTAESSADGGTGGGALPPLRYGCGAGAAPGALGVGCAWLLLATLRRRSGRR